MMRYHRQDLCMLMFLVLFHSPPTAFSAVSFATVSRTKDKKDETATAAAAATTTTTTENRQTAKTQYALRASYLSSSLHHHSHMQVVERIVDTDALEEIDGDPKDKEFIFHPPGHEANVQDYPFFAHWSRAMCGASIVHDDILLTAGHCGGKATEPFLRKQVRLLSKYRESGGITRHIAHLEINPNYNHNLQENDFQLIKLDSSVLVDSHGNATGAALVKLNNDRQNPAPGDPIQAVGFGTVTPDGHTGNSQVLMDTTLQAFSIDHCDNQYGPGQVVEEIMICVGTLDGSADTCQGDSGGPLLDEDDVQIGVVSWGVGCARADHAGVASRVSAVADWIESGICRLSAMPPESCDPKETISLNNRLPTMDVGSNAVDASTDQENDTFQLRVTVRHDSAPEETAWSLTHEDSYALLYFQPYDTVPAPFVDVSHVFQGLTAGTYLFEIGDSKEDGICCEFGEGSVSISNQNNHVLWKHKGDFAQYLGATLSIDEGGNLIDVRESTNWTSPANNATAVNSKTYVNDPEHTDEDWPGYFPRTQDSITVNIKLDSNPQEVSWTVHYLKNTSSLAATQTVKDGGDLADVLDTLTFWEKEEDSADEEKGEEETVVEDPTANQWVQMYSANSVNPNTLESETLEDLQPGLYQFTIHDTAGNGICCDYRFGWITLTTNNGPCDITGDCHEILWENNGEFDYKVQVTIEFTDLGNFEVSSRAKEGEKSIALTFLLYEES